MRIGKYSMRSSLAVGVALLFTACGNPSPPAEPSPAVPAPQAPAVAPPASASVPEAMQAPAPVPAAATQAPAMSEPSRKIAIADPALSAMALAEVRSSKIGVPVDLRYQFDGDVDSGQAVTLHLAAVPRVPGDNLKVSIKDVSGIRLSAGPMNAQKVSASTAYRQQLSVSKLAGGPKELRVLVTMDLPEGAAFGWFSVPFSAALPASKVAPVKMQ